MANLNSEVSRGQIDGVQVQKQVAKRQSSGFCAWCVPPGILCQWTVLAGLVLYKALDFIQAS